MRDQTGSMRVARWAGQAMVPGGRSRPLMMLFGVMAAWWIAGQAQSAGTAGAAAPGEGAKRGVEIRSVDGGHVLITADEIRAYDWTSHTLTLAPGVREALKKRLPRERIVSGIPFIVAVEGEEAYTGRFTTRVSSFSFPTPVIVIDAKAMDRGPGDDELRIQLGYPTAEFFKGDDPRGDERIRAALEAGGKLKAADSDAGGHEAWLASCLREMQTIKPGMTREQLLAVFEEEAGGVSNRLAQRYAYRGCPTIKVDVRFEPAEAPQDKLTKSPNDRITQISTPFLEWPIVD